MSKGGKREGSGRPKGAENRITTEARIQAEARSSGLTDFNKKLRSGVSEQSSVLIMSSMTSSGLIPTAALTDLEDQMCIIRRKQTGRCGRMSNWTSYVSRRLICLFLSQSSVLIISSITSSGLIPSASA
jgi:hypothetical protein